MLHSHNQSNHGRRGAKEAPPLGHDATQLTFEQAAEAQSWEEATRSRADLQAVVTAGAAVVESGLSAAPDVLMSRAAQDKRVGYMHDVGLPLPSKQGAST
jgi:hypothetical protein